MNCEFWFWWMLMCLVDVDVFEDRSRGVGGRLGDNVDVARALACARAHSTSIIIYYFNYFVG